MISKIKYLYFLLITATLVMAASAFLMIAGLVQESQRIENTARNTLVGLTLQTDYEIQRFVEGLTLFSTSRSNVSKNSLVDRYDILWSRYNTNTSGKSGSTYLTLKGAEAAMNELLSLLQANEASLQALQVGDTETARRLADNFRTLIPVFHRIALEATNLTTKTSYTLHDHLTKVGFWANIFLPGILITGFIAGAILWRESRSLSQLTKNLEFRVQERTQDLRLANTALKEEVTERKLIEEKLIQSQRMEIVGQLTGGVAHDFNNFLAVIQGNAELLEDIAEENQKAFIKPILRATQKGSELTQRLLAFSRQQPLRPKMLDISQLVSNMSVLFKGTIRESISVDIVFENNLWGALADPHQLENALLNLVVNSSHAMRSGGDLTIECSNVTMESTYLKLHPEASPGDYVVLSVSDTGTGIPKDIQDHVFEPFFTTKEIGEGSGLGLSMVYGFAKQSGGHVDIDSEVGVGTTVKLFLPRSATTNSLYPSADSDHIAHSGKGECVLVVEDNEDVRLLAKKTLTSLNYKVVIAEDAKAASQILNTEQKIDIILSDVVLPGSVSGPEFFKAIQHDFPDMKVIFMSGYSADHAKKDRLLAADHILLNKPFQRHKLATALHKALN